MTIGSIARTAWLAAVLAASLGVPGCGDAPAPTAAEPAPREVEIAHLVRADVPWPLRAVGRTASSQRVEIRSRVAGFLDDIAFEEGGVVAAGDVLYHIDPKPFEARLRAARGELAQQQARLQNAEALLARIEPLAEVDAVARKELDDATGRMREAAAAVEAASARVFEAELELGYTTITSPVDGLVSQSVQREGAYVSIGAAALTYVARIDPIWVEFSVSETQALRSERSVDEGTLVLPEDRAFEVEIALSSGDLHPYSGRISFADASVSEATGTFLVRAEIPNPEKTLRPGQYVQVLIKGAYRPDAIVVPRRAVREGPKGPFVWVVDDESRAELRPVIAGPWTDEGWIIERGLSVDDRLIVNGTVALAPGTPVSITSVARRDAPQ